jgi:hypothetical protein
MNGTHIEKPCNQVLNPAGSALAARFNAEAEAWWGSVVAEPDSFTKPVYLLGLSGEEASNVEAQGAVQITRVSVAMTSRALYSKVRDNVCMEAKVSGFEHSWKALGGCFKVTSACQLCTCCNC